MRWLLLLMVVLIPIVGPAVATSSDALGRSQDLIDCSAPTEVIVHRDETAGTYITVHNTADVNQRITVQALSVPEPLTTVGLPATLELVPNHLKQFSFGVRAPADAAFQTMTVTFAITSDVDPDVNETVMMNVTVAPRSNLNFGVDDFASFTVDETVRTAVAVNITNNASFTDEVTFSLYSTSSWAWGWSMPLTAGEEAYTTMAPDSLSYVYLWVDVPPVLDGAPLAQTGPRFTLSAVSGLDNALSTWTFDLLMNEKKNVSIDRLDASLTVAPNQDGRINAVVRNVGNTPNTLNITLQGLNPDGTPMLNAPASDRFSSNGWVVALFGGLEDVLLQPNESRVVEIGFQSPNDFVGEMHVELRVFASGASAAERTARTVATIERISSASASVNANECSSMLPNTSCQADITVENTGNAYNTLVLRHKSTTGGFIVGVPSVGLVMQPGESKTFPPVVVNAPEEASAFSLGSSVIEVLDDTGEVVDEVTLEFTIAPVIKWTFRNVDEELSVMGRLSVALEVRNDGNAVDGLVVQLQSSHAVDMGLIPPESALYEEGVEFPRSFEINDVPLNANITFRAWVQLPQDQTSNGTVYLNTTVRSKLAPDTFFVHTSTGDYLGVPWQSDPDEQGGLDWGSMANTAMLYARAWGGVIASVVLASLILYKAVVDRKRRLERASVLPYQEVQETSDDWMSKYQNESPVEPTPVVQPTASVPNETYQAMFRHEHGTASPAQPTVDSALVSAATSVLDGPQRKKKTPNESADVPNRTLPLPPNDDARQPVDDLEF